MKIAAAYGTWPSEITAELMCSSSIGLSQPYLFNREIYWLENRPQEQGRSVIVKLTLPEDLKSIDHNQRTEVIPAHFNCRTQVHEYGGACYLPTEEGVFFVNHLDQQVYKATADSIEPLTLQDKTRFADFAYSSERRMLVAVAEIHGKDRAEPKNTLVSIDIDSGAVTTLAEGHDFYASAVFSADGGSLSWLTWDHPNMPWDGTELWLAEVVDSVSLSGVQKIAGGDTESVFQPQWSPDGELYFVSDRSNWWNIYRHTAEGVQPVCAMDAEFGLPQWVFGMRRYGFADQNTIVTSCSQAGIDNLAVVDLHAGTFTAIPAEYTGFQSIFSAEGLVCYIAQSPTTFPCLYVSAAESLADTAIRVCQSSSIDINAANFSQGAAISYPTADGGNAHGFYYPPTHVDFQGLAGELPPLIVMIHGGPTSATQNDLSLKIQFWTNRGFAVFDSNYRGSTGFGREYRDALKNNWGVTDVEDCDYGVRYLVSQKLADEKRVAIRGGSAGGFTTLAALALTDTFKAGASLYGVTDLTSLATDTHKFESRYLDSLIGPYPAEKALYESRSPINHADEINCPVIFLQGLDDKVVPPSQAEMMIEVLLKNGVKVAYLPFEGEGHGFRKSDTIIEAFAAELWFYGEVFGFGGEPVEGVEFLTA